MEVEVDEDSFVDDLQNCVLCENSDGVMKLTESLANNLATNLANFKKHDVLDNSLNGKVREAVTTEAHLQKKLKARSYNIHKRCYDKFNNSHLQKKISSKKRKIDSASPSCSTRSSTEPDHMFAEECMYCGEPDKYDPKHPDKTKQLRAAAGRGRNSSYVDDFTDRVRNMATELGDIKLLKELGNDVRSSELYYHNCCHVNYRNKYKKQREQNNIQFEQMVFDGDTLIPDDKSFLTDENNKSRLNAFTIQNFINSCLG